MMPTKSKGEYVVMIEKYLSQFWRCTDMDSTEVDEFVSEAFSFKEKLTDKKLILSGMHLEYSTDEPYCPYLAFETWDLRADELNPGYWPTGPLLLLVPIKNGFVAVTGDSKGKTTYTFKKTTINPIERFLRRQGKQGSEKTYSQDEVEQLITGEESV